MNKNWYVTSTNAAINLYNTYEGAVNRAKKLAHSNDGEYSIYELKAVTKTPAPNIDIETI